MADISRNDPCPCGSGKKYKSCHLGREQELAPSSAAKPIALVIAALAALTLGALVYTSKGFQAGLAVALGGLMLVGITAILWKPPPPGAGGDSGAINFGK